MRPIIWQPRKFLGITFLLLTVCPLTRAGEGEGLSLHGEVVAVSTAKMTLMLRHEPVSGFTERSETEFFISKGEALIVQPGEKIRGRVVPFSDGYRLEHIWPVDPISDKIADDVNQQLRQDTVIRGFKAFRAVGEYIPNFALYNQDGQLVQSRAWRNKKVVLNFIFTRCQMPMMCPAATQRMMRLQEEGREAGIDKLQLVSISFDPTYDSPGVLKQYTEDRSIDTSNFMFLTGASRAIEDILKQFGIITFDEEGTIKHTMATILIDEKGKIIFRKEGTRWEVNEFLERLR